jgi:hypothetical protein
MGRLGHTLSTLRPVGHPARTQDSLPGVGQTLPGGLKAHWVPPKGFFDASYIAFLLSQAYPGASALRSQGTSPSQLGGPGKTALSAWFSAVPGGFRRASWSAQRGDFSAWYPSARRRPCRGHCPVRLAVLRRSTKAVCGGAGCDLSQVNVANGNHAIAGSIRGSGSPVMGPKRSPAQGYKRGRLAGV